VCGTTGKRKACKDCSCGLADELANEGKGKENVKELPKSSCGSVSCLEEFLERFDQIKVSVLFGRRVPLRQLSVFGDAGVQTRGKGPTERQSFKGRYLIDLHISNNMYKYSLHNKSDK
jgi:hypothetical protein